MLLKRFVLPGNSESNECNSPEGLIEKRISELATSHYDGESDDDNDDAESNVDCQDFNSQFTCNCMKNWFTTFSDVEINDNKFGMREMSKAEKEMYVMDCCRKGLGQITQRKAAARTVISGFLYAAR